MFMYMYMSVYILYSWSFFIYYRNCLCKSLCKYCQILEFNKSDCESLHVPVDYLEHILESLKCTSLFNFLCAIKRMIKGQGLSVFNLVELHVSEL